MKANAAMEYFSAHEIKRKSFHSLIIFYILGYWALPRDIVLWTIGAIILVVILAEVVRLSIPAFNRWILNLFGGMHREEEVNSLSGLPWTLTGSFLTMLIFPDKRIVLISFLYLVFGDAFAALIGKRWGRRTIIKGKTFEGSLACFLVCLIIGLFFLSWPVALIGAILAAAIEIIPWPLNDNFWMPLISAAALTLLIPIFG